MTEAMTYSSALPFFDTLAAYRSLTAAGMSETQAEALVQVQVRLLTSRLATKADVKDLGNAIRADFKDLGDAIRANVREFRNATKADFEGFRNTPDTGLKKLQNAPPRPISPPIDTDLKELQALRKKRANILKWYVAFQIGTASMIIAAAKLL